MPGRSSDFYSRFLLRNLIARESALSRTRMAINQNYVNTDARAEYTILALRRAHFACRDIRFSKMCTIRGKFIFHFIPLFLFYFINGTYQTRRGTRDGARDIQILTMHPHLRFPPRDLGEILLDLSELVA